jgi:Domain of unknown function (DUF6468)
MSGSLIVEGALAALILATLGYCALLELRLRALRQDQTNLNGTIRAINSALAAARAQLAALRGSAGQTVETLTTHVTTARALADELSMLILLGKGVAERIQENTTGVPILPPKEQEIAPQPAEIPDKVSNAG